MNPPKSGNGFTYILRNERQPLSYLSLKIWTIFTSAQIASNDAHASEYILHRKCVDIVVA